MTVLKNILEARKPMMHDESCTYAGTMRKGECPGCGAVGTDLNMGAKDSMSEAVDEIDTADFKLNKAGKKTKAHKIVFRTGEDETQVKKEPTKVREGTEMDAQLEEMTDAQMTERDRLVKGMKKSYKGFVDKYGKERAKSVMYATATKNAMKEDLDEASSYLAINPKTRMVDKVCDTKEERDEYIKSKGGTHMAMQTPKGQKKVGDKYMREDIDEAYFPDPKDAVSAKPANGRITRTQHRVKTTDTGAIYTKEYDPAGISKGSGAAAAEPKRGRGRPKKDKFAESFAALLAMNETQFDMFAESLSEEAFEAFTAALKV